MPAPTLHYRPPDDTPVPTPWWRLAPGPVLIAWAGACFLYDAVNGDPTSRRAFMNYLYAALLTPLVGAWWLWHVVRLCRRTRHWWMIPVAIVLFALAAWLWLLNLEDALAHPAFRGFWADWWAAPHF